MSQSTKSGYYVSKPLVVGDLKIAIVNCGTVGDSKTYF